MNISKPGESLKTAVLWLGLYRLAAAGDTLKEKATACKGSGISRPYVQLLAQAPR